MIDRVHPDSEENLKNFSLLNPILFGWFTSPHKSDRQPDASAQRMKLFKNELNYIADEIRVPRRQFHYILKDEVSKGISNSNGHGHSHFAIFGDGLSSFRIEANCSRIADIINRELPGKNHCKNYDMREFGRRGLMYTLKTRNRVGAYVYNHAMLPSAGLERLLKWKKTNAPELL